MFWTVTDRRCAGAGVRLSIRPQGRQAHQAVRPAARARARRRWCRCSRSSSRRATGSRSSPIYRCRRVRMRTATAGPDSPVPLVLNVHGGPWARDAYGFDNEHQWLANRGYAVLAGELPRLHRLRQELRQRRQQGVGRQDARRPARCRELGRQARRSPPRTRSRSTAVRMAVTPRWSASRSRRTRSRAAWISSGRRNLDTLAGVDSAVLEELSTKSSRRASAIRARRRARSC